MKPALYPKRALYHTDNIPHPDLLKDFQFIISNQNDILSAIIKQHFR